MSNKFRKNISSAFETKKYSLKAFSVILKALSKNTKTNTEIIN